MTSDEQNRHLLEVAALVASLDSTTADTLLDRLTEEQARRVRLAVAQLDELPQERQQSMAEDFLEVIRGAEANGLGPAGTQDSLAQVEFVSDEEALPFQAILESELASNPVSEVPVRVDPQPLAAAQPLSRGVSQAPKLATEAMRTSGSSSIDQIAKHLRDEHPQTIAAVLSTLAPARAAALIQSLPSSQQYEVVRRIAEMQPTDDESLHEVEKEIRERIQREHESDKNLHSGYEAVRSILQFADSKSRREILQNLTHHDADWAEKIEQPSRWLPVEEREPIDAAEAFEQLVHLDASSLTTLFQFVPHRLAATALAGARAASLNSLMSALPEPLAETLRDELSAIGPLRLSDIQEAQSTVAKAARGMIRESADLQDGGRLRLTA